MADTSNRNAAGFRRRLALCFASAVLALAGMPAFAQTSVVNRATVTPPAGVANPGTTCAASGGAYNADGNQECSASDTDSVAAPLLNLTKAHTGDFTVGANGVYTLQASNTGTAPTTGTITVTDVLPASLTFVSATGAGWTCAEAPAQTVTCTSTTPIAAGSPATPTLGAPITLTVAVAAAAAPSVINTARASGGGDDTCPAAPAATLARCSPSDTTTVNQALINATKSAINVTGPSAAAVYTVNYTVTVSNTGTAAGTYGTLIDTPVFPANTSITGASWTTTGAGAPAGGSSTASGPYQLAPAATAIAVGATHSYNVSITFIYTNSALPTVCAATPTPGSGLYNDASLPPGQETSTTDNAVCLNPPSPPAPLMTVDKTASTATYATPNQIVNYSYLVTNTGNVSISAIAVADDRIATVTCPVTTLAPGADTTCTGSYTITQADLDNGTVTNIAVANGTPAGGTLTPPTDTVTITATQTPSQTLTKVLSNDSTGGTAAVGDVLTYTVTLTNTGNTTLTGVVVSDPKITPNSITCASVAPSGTCILSGAYTVLQADADAGTLQNMATATSALCPVGGA
ncbi:MAG TPA: hypothetical protein VGC09_22640, partial [Rhodopila sp.]